MKKSMLVLNLAFLAAAPASLDARQNAGTANVSKSKPVTMVGKFDTHGAIFIADQDNRIWKVANAAGFERLDGRHVLVKVKVEPANSAIYVVSVHASEPEHHAVNVQDAAFRR